MRFFLPPANEIWGKVMFLHLSVILFTWGGVSVPACITDHMTGGSCPGGLCLGVSLDRDTPRMVISGQYASYRKAFLFIASFYLFSASSVADEGKGTPTYNIEIYTRMHSSRMRTARSCRGGSPPGTPWRQAPPPHPKAGAPVTRPPQTRHPLPL